MEIPEDTKMFLRAVLVSTPGMQQSHVAKEYQQTTGEQIQFTKYGFKNIYAFLIALEGKVTRLEFSPKHGENLVYAVLDETKYFSKHAAKYANKVRSGMKSKSPQEVLLWKKEHKSTLPVIVKKTGRKHTRIHQTKRGKIKFETKTKEVAPTVSEWVALRKLLPDSEGVFSLKIRNIGVNQRKVKFDDRALCVHFSPYNAMSSSIKTCANHDNDFVSFISFPSFFTAYRAWKEKDKTIILGNRIGVEPAGGNVKDLAGGKYMIFVINIPEGLLMSTFVTLFSKFPGLICIDPRPREHCALITYSTSESAERACAEVTSVSVNGNKLPITVQLLDERPAMSFGSVNSNLLKSLDNKPVGNANVKMNQPVSNETEESTESHNVVACGFCITYEQFFQMFHITCRKKPNTLENVPNEIQFLVTHQIDPIRFWGWLMTDSKESARKLTEIEQSISTTAVKIQPPHVLPKEGHRGAALYREEDKETWYRCYVLSSNVETEEVEVFYCDYGNSEVIPKVLFRSTYNDAWTLQPQAVPFRMHGFELRNPHDLKSTDRLNLEDGQVLKATVVKTAVYSQPHVIEIKDVSYVSVNSCSIDEKILGSWCIPVGSTCSGNNADVGDKLYETCSDMKDNGCDKMQDSKETTEFQADKSVMESIFDYNDEDLVLGLLAESHNPSLLYLKLGDVSQFAKLQIAIDEAELTFPEYVNKGDTLLLNSKGQRLRVLILQVLPAYGNAKVLHVDYGVIEWVVTKDLYSLNQDLRDSPFQARPAALAGIDCKEKMDAAVLYLKGKAKVVIKTNVIHENSSGKIHVELFDLQTNKSINKEMIDIGLAVRILNEVTDTDEELSPNMIPVKEVNTGVPQGGLFPLTTSISNEIGNILSTLQLGHPCQQAASSAPSWNSQPSNSFQGDNDYNTNLPSYSDVPKLMEVCTWLDKSPTKREMHHNTGEDDEIASSMSSQDIINFESEELIGKDKVGSQFGSNIQGNKNKENNITNSSVNAPRDGNNSYEHFFQEGDQVISKKNDTSYPPPDIIASNKVNDIQVDQGISVDGRKIRIGDDNEVLSVDKNNKLSTKEVNEIQQKWVMEKTQLVQTKGKLEHLMNMSNDDLTQYYKFMKKEKLHLKLRIKKGQKYLNKLESEYERYIQETNHILSLI